jgi:hypothetical protein
LGTPNKISFYLFKKKYINQSLVGSVVISAEFDRKDYSSIPATAIERGLKPLDTKTDPNEFQVLVKTKKKKEIHQIR